MYKSWQQLDKCLSALLGLMVDRAILVDIPENISIDAMYDFLQTNYQPQPKPQSIPPAPQNPLPSPTRQFRIGQ
jgi:hypothetical protein